MTVEEVIARIRRAKIGAYGDDELGMLIRTFAQLQPDHVFDWGTNVGSSARAFYEMSQAFGTDTTVHTVDLPDDVPHNEHPGKRHGMHLKDTPVLTYRGDGVGVSMAICKVVLPVRPMFFVDGDHHAANVFRELRTIHENVKNPVIFVHDTNAHSGDGVTMFKAVYPDMYQVMFLKSQAGLTRLWRRV